MIKSRNFTQLSKSTAKFILSPFVVHNTGISPNSFFNMDNHSKIPLFKCIKGESLHEGTIGAGGLLLGAEDAVEQAGVSYALTLAYSTNFSFLFGFRGIGCHYRCDIQPRHGIIALYQMKDGIPLYLHHVSTILSLGAEIKIIWHARAIRVTLHGYTILNVITDGPKSGHWCFAALGEPLSVPALTSSLVALEKYEWICLGDGFSNARWRNRHFLSWPEILWGHGDSCLNACVAAGNSSRTLEVVRDLGTVLEGAKVIVATGSDDLIEGEAFENYSIRLEQITSKLRQDGADGIYLCTLPPRNSDLKNTRTWSEEIKKFAKFHAIQVLDVHDWILPETANCMVRGEYPGTAAQKLIARKIAAQLGLQLPTTCPVTIDPQLPLRRRTAALARKVERMLGPFTQDFPGLLR
jgi:hypothetical protein